MQTKYGFQLMDIDEFENWLAAQRVTRVIQLIQNHHTYLPDYTHFTGSNHFERLQSMKQYHMVNNGWSDIAQTLTTFPDGKVAVCRPLNQVPVGIKGHNSRGICIEHFGNFDVGRDQMNPAHAKTIVALNAMLCKKFSLPVDTDHIVYHHWYDLNNGARLNGKGVTKSCPGTAFFGGNTVEAANQGFIPLIKKSGLAVKADVLPDKESVDEKPIGFGIIMVSKLNVRKGPGGSFGLLSALTAGAMVNIYDQQDGWIKISTGSEWVSDKYVTRVLKARVTCNSLNARTGPGGSFSKIATLPKDTEVLVYEQQGGWARIDINEKWVYATYLKFD